VESIVGLELKGNESPEGLIGRLEDNYRELNPILKFSKSEEYLISEGSISIAWYNITLKRVFKFVKEVSMDRYVVWTNVSNKTIVLRKRNHVGMFEGGELLLYRPVVLR